MSLTINEVWNSAFWRGKEEAIIADFRAAILSCDSVEIEAATATLFHVYERIAITTVEELTRAFWTNSQWAEVEDRARAELEHYRNPATAPDVDPVDRAQIIADAEAELAFYQGERLRRFDSLLGEVTL